MISQKNFNVLLEEKLPKIDELARNVDRISLAVDSLKLRSIPPKHDINDTTKKYTSMMIHVCHSRSRFLSCMYCIMLLVHFPTRSSSIVTVDMKRNACVRW